MQLVIEALQAAPRLEIMHEQSNLQGRGRSETGRQQSICCCRASGKTLFILCMLPSLKELGRKWLQWLQSLCLLSMASLTSIESTDPARPCASQAWGAARGGSRGTRSISAVEWINFLTLWQVPTAESPRQPGPQSGAQADVVKTGQANILAHPLPSLPNCELLLFPTRICDL